MAGAAVLGRVGGSGAASADNVRGLQSMSRRSYRVNRQVMIFAFYVDFVYVCCVEKGVKVKAQSSKMRVESSSHSLCSVTAKLKVENSMLKGGK